MTRFNSLIVQFSYFSFVSSVAVNGAKNAGILAAQIIASFDDDVRFRMKLFRRQLAKKVEDAIVNLQKNKSVSLKEDHRNG